MRAAVLVGKGNSDKAFQVQEWEKPSPSEGEVLIKVECFGLNYADVMARRGLYRETPPMPCVIGYEVVGTVEAVGSQKDNELIGKRVVGMTRFGGYAEYAVTKLEGIAEIGDMDAGVAACLGTQYVTANYMVEECINLHPDDYVLVHAGAGGVGTALIQICVNKGCKVVATAGSEEKLEYMKSQGAHHVINYRSSDYEAESRRILGDERFRATFNPIAGSTFKKDFRLVGSGGAVILFGGSERSGKKWGIFSTLNFVRKMGLIIPIGLMMRSKSILGTNMLKISDHAPKLIAHNLKDVAQKVINGDLNPHVGARYKIDQLAEAHDLLEGRKSIGKIVVFWD